MSRVDPVFSNNASRLQAYRSLRNSLVHEPSGGPAEPIAEPRLDVVEDYRRLVEYALKPPTALATIAVREVFTVTWSTPVVPALRQMVSRSFRLAPVVEEGVVAGAFTESTLLELAARDGVVTIDDATTFSRFRSVTALERPVRGISFLSDAATVVDAESAFANAFGRGEVLSVVLITPNGKALEPLSGIITAHDLPSASGARMV